MEKGYKYVGHFMTLLIALVFFAFFKTYFNAIPGLSSMLEILIHSHAFFMITWVLLLIVQPILILYKKNKLHKLLGKITYGVFPMVILTSIGMMFHVYHRGIINGLAIADNLKNLLFPVVCGIMMVLFFGLSIRDIKNKNIGGHMRYMVALAIILLDQTITRIGIFWFDIPFPNVMFFTYGITDFILLALILYDVLYKRDYRPYLLALGCFLLYHASFCVLYRDLLKP
ncbi:MAG: hypothetical protein AAF990_21440 [Bacteroidota bacterium]